MKKDKTKINKKIYTIIVSIALLVINGIIINFTKIGNLDEIWNFNLAKNFASGMVPYKDFNFIVTPLFPFTVSLFFRIFGTKLIVQRILTYVSLNIMLFLVYKILDKNIDEKIKMFFIICIDYAFINYFYIEYNFLSLILMLIMLHIELKSIDSKTTNGKKKNALIGFLCGLTILTKQTTGIIMILVLSLYNIIFITRKEDLKQSFKNSLIFATTAFVTTIPFIIYLFITKSYLDFIDLCILGIRTFTNTVNLIIPLIGIIVLAIIAIVLKVKKTEDKKTLVFYAYSVIDFIICIPIADKLHLLTACIIPLMFIIYLIYHKINNADKFNYKEIKLYTVIVMLMLIALSGIKITDIKVNSQREKKIQEFKGLYIKRSTRNIIEEVDQYILEEKLKGNEVYILDGASAFFNIPLNIYRKYYDLLLIGNIGIKGEDGIIEDIKNKDNAIYLICEKETTLQNCEKVINFVEENYDHVGELSIFKVYKKPVE